MQFGLLYFLYVWLVLFVDLFGFWLVGCLQVVFPGRLCCDAWLRCIGSLFVGCGFWCLCVWLRWFSVVFMLFGCCLLACFCGCVG